MKRTSGDNPGKLIAAAGLGAIVAAVILMLISTAQRKNDQADFDEERAKLNANITKEKADHKKTTTFYEQTRDERGPTPRGVGQTHAEPEGPDPLARAGRDRDTSGATG